MNTQSDALPCCGYPDGAGHRDNCEGIWNEEHLLERIATLEAERDRAREECGYEKAMRRHSSGENSRHVLQLSAARKALQETGYWSDPDQVGWDLAPRIVELWSAFGWCFCKDAALLRGEPLTVHGVEHTREGCHYTDAT